MHLSPPSLRFREAVLEDLGLNIELTTAALGTPATSRGMRFELTSNTFLKVRLSRRHGGTRLGVGHAAFLNTKK